MTNSAILNDKDKAKTILVSSSYTPDMSEYYTQGIEFTGGKSKYLEQVFGSNNRSLQITKDQLIKHIPKELQSLKSSLKSQQDVCKNEVKDYFDLIKSKLLESDVVSLRDKLFSNEGEVTRQTFIDNPELIKETVEFSEMLSAVLSDVIDKFKKPVHPIQIEHKDTLEKIKEGKVFEGYICWEKARKFNVDEEFDALYEKYDLEERMPLKWTAKKRRAFVSLSKNFGKFLDFFNKGQGNFVFQGDIDRIDKKFRQYLVQSFKESLGIILPPSRVKINKEHEEILRLIEKNSRIIQDAIEITNLVTVVSRKAGKK